LLPSVPCTIVGLGQEKRIEAPHQAWRSRRGRCSRPIERRRQTGRLKPAQCRNSSFVENGDPPSLPGFFISL
jgi:hypothetical protein